MVEIKVEPGTDLPVEVQLLVEGVDSLSEADVINYILGAGIHPDNFEVTSAEISHSNEQFVEKTVAPDPEGRGSFFSTLKRLIRAAAARNRENGITDIADLIFLCPKDRSASKFRNKRKPSYKYKKLFLKHYQLGQKFKKQQEINRKAVEELKKKIQVLKDKMRGQIESEIKRRLSGFLTDNQTKLLLHGDTNINWKREDFIHCFALKSLNPQSYHYVRNVMNFPLPDEFTINRWITKQESDKKGTLLDYFLRLMRRFHRKFLFMEDIPPPVQEKLTKIILGNPKSNDFTQESEEAVSNITIDKHLESVPTQVLNRYQKSGVGKKLMPTRKQKNLSNKEGEESVDEMDVIKIEETFTIDDEDDPEWLPTPQEMRLTNSTAKVDEEKSVVIALKEQEETPKKKLILSANESDLLTERLNEHLENMFHSDEQLSDEPEEMVCKIKDPDKVLDALKVLDMLSDPVEPVKPESPVHVGRTKRIIKPTQRLLESDTLSRKSKQDGSEVKRQFARKSTTPKLGNSVTSKKTIADKSKVSSYQSADKSKSSSSLNTDKSNSTPSGKLTRASADKNKQTPDVTDKSKQPVAAITEKTKQTPKSVTVKSNSSSGVVTDKSKPLVTEKNKPSPCVLTDKSKLSSRLVADKEKPSTCTDKSTDKSKPSPAMVTDNNKNSPGVVTNKNKTGNISDKSKSSINVVENSRLLRSSSNNQGIPPLKIISIKRGDSRLSTAGSSVSKSSSAEVTDIEKPLESSSVDKEKPLESSSVDKENPSLDPVVKVSPLNNTTIGNSKANDSVKQVLLMRTRRSLKRQLQAPQEVPKKKLCPKSEFLSNLSMCENPPKV